METGDHNFDRNEKITEIVSKYFSQTLKRFFSVIYLRLIGAELDGVFDIPPPQSMVENLE